jgi:hypothetical protein
LADRRRLSRASRWAADGWSSALTETICRTIALTAMRTAVSRPADDRVGSNE